MGMISRRGFVNGATAMGVGLAASQIVSANLATATSPGSTAARLPRSTPKALNVSSAAIMEFVKAWEKPDANGLTAPRSFMLLRQGKVIAESWWKPHRPEAPTLLYSLTKTFTATAIGFLEGDGLLRVTDKVISFFPDKLPETVSPHLAALEVRHLLTMTVGHKSDMSMRVLAEKDWVRAFLSFPIPEAPGTAFVYNSSATMILAAIAEKLSGKPLLTLLEERLMRPLGASGQLVSPRGAIYDGVLMSATPEAIAKMGQLLLQGGMWNGRQLLSRDWVSRMTSAQVQQSPNWSFQGLGEPKQTLEELQATSDYYHGYGYQMWRGRNNSYRADGALGQVMIALPEQEAIFVMISEDREWQKAMDLVWSTLLPAFAGRRPEDDDLALAALLGSRALPVPTGNVVSPIGTKIDGDVFILKPNDLGAEKATFRFRDGKASIDLGFTDGRTSSLTGAFGQWLDTTSDMPGTPPFLFTAVMPGGDPVQPVACRAIWLDDRTLELRSSFYRTPHQDRITCKFGERNVEIEFLSSPAAMMQAPHGVRRSNDERPILTGSLSAA